MIAEEKRHTVEVMRAMEDSAIRDQL